MGQLRIVERRQGRVVLEGPWLLSRADLKELAGIVEEIWLALPEKIASAALQGSGGHKAMRIVAESASVAQARKALVKYVSEERTRKCEVLLGEGKIASSERIDEFLAPGALKLEVPSSIYIELKVDEVFLSVNLAKDVTVATGIWESDVALDLAAQVIAWLEEKRPSLWVRLWVGLWPSPLGIWIAGFMWVRMSGRSAQLPGKGQVEALLQDGIDAGEANKALEMILRHQYGVNLPSASPAQSESWLAPALVIASIALLALMIIPRSCFGIGRGESRVKLNRRWIGFVVVALPGYIVLQLVVPWVFGEIMSRASR